MILEITNALYSKLKIKVLTYFMLRWLGFYRFVNNFFMTTDRILIIYVMIAWVSGIFLIFATLFTLNYLNYLFAKKLGDL